MIFESVIMFWSNILCFRSFLFCSLEQQSSPMIKMCTKRIVVVSLNKLLRYTLIYEQEVGDLHRKEVASHSKTRITYVHINPVKYLRQYI